MEFFVLEDPRPGTPEDRMAGTRASRAEGTKVGEAPRCPNCGRFIGMLTWLPPFEVEIETRGEQPGDVASVSADELIVSERFRNSFEVEGLTGLFDFDAVQIKASRRHRQLRVGFPTYFKANVIRSRSTVDQEASGFEWEDSEPVCPICLWKKNSSGTLRAHKSVVIKAGTWLGEDIFYPRGSPVNIIVSTRFKTFCETHKMLNVSFMPAASYAWEKKSWEP